MSDRFAEWLERARVTDDPEGDFVADMRADMRINSDRPQTFTSLRALRCYVSLRGGDREVLAAVSAAWRRYRRWLGRKERGR
jgi:hypothetical protein